MYRHYILLFLTAMVVAENNINRVLFPKDVTIDAAFRYVDGDLILISGDEYMAVTPENTERYIKVRSGKSKVPASDRIQAAIRWPLKPVVYYYGSNYSFNTNLDMKTSQKAEYGQYREFLQNGGPDAVSFKAGWFYLFKGCEYVTQRATLYHLGDRHNISEINENLPCDIDAAWTDIDLRGMTILKGDQIWRWTDEVEGPYPFEDHYLIWSWQLKPTPDNRFEL